MSAELFATKGIASTTVRDIGNAAGVFPGSLYHHFTSKDELVAEILGGYVEEIRRRSEQAVLRGGSPKDTIRELIKETLTVIDEYPHPTAMLQNERGYLREHGLFEPIKKSSRAARSYWMKAIRAGIADGSFREDIPEEIFYRSVRESLWSSMHWPNRRRYSTSTFADLLDKLFLAGFSAP
ncbi:TetR/AcrR family transcriptional regulator [Amycolatopsis taiwanensis]|nr:TetR/AcrR family transcriptional regulator [Amycolatopsis taiwanensis]